MFYTYILEAIDNPDKRYIGHTTELKKRLSEHNSGRCNHISKHRPWKIKLYIAFETLALAQSCERYLKSGSGHAFFKRHFY